MLFKGIKGQLIKCYKSLIPLIPRSICFQNILTPRNNFESTVMIESSVKIFVYNPVQIKVGNIGVAENTILPSNILST